MTHPSSKAARELEEDASRSRTLDSAAADAEPASGAPATDVPPARPLRAAVSSPWLTYAEAAAYTGWTVAYLRNLVSAGAIPVYGRPRVRRFRRDVLDEYLTDPDAAMRRFRAERNPHGR